MLGARQRAPSHATTDARMPTVILEDEMRSGYLILRTDFSLQLNDDREVVTGCSNEDRDTFIRPTYHPARPVERCRSSVAPISPRRRSCCVTCSRKRLAPPCCSRSRPPLPPSPCWRLRWPTPQDPSRTGTPTPSLETSWCRRASGRPTPTSPPGLRSFPLGVVPAGIRARRQLPVARTRASSTTTRSTRA